MTDTRKLPTVDEIMKAVKVLRKHRAKPQLGYYWFGPDGIPFRPTKAGARKLLRGLASIDALERRIRLWVIAKATKAAIAQVLKEFNR